MDMGTFKIKPNCFIIFVAPPGVVAKSTTSGQGMGLLKKVPGINFGPSSSTWQALFQYFGEVSETVRYEGKDYKQSNVTIEASELGTFLDMNNREMIDQIVDLWDAKETKHVRRTKGDGEEEVMSPWINLIACTTPSWIASTMTQYAIGGGFTSRCIFVYADKKQNVIAYPADHIPKHHAGLKKNLVEDLTRISELKGVFTLSPKAKALATEWYEQHCTQLDKHLKDARLGGYVARKQTHLHKIMMCLSAADGDDMIMTDTHFHTAIALLGMMENSLPKVFNAISDDYDVKTLNVLKQMLASVVEPGKSISHPEAYTAVSSVISFQNFAKAIEAAVFEGSLDQVQTRGGTNYKPNHDIINQNFKVMGSKEKQTILDTIAGR